MRIEATFNVLLVSVLDDILFVDAEVRLSVFESLDDSFDKYLAQYENLTALFVGLNDEDNEIREIAVRVVGRLSTRNPSYIMPSLRKTLIQVRSQIR